MAVMVRQSCRLRCEPHESGSDIDPLGHVRVIHCGVDAEERTERSNRRVRPKANGHSGINQRSHRIDPIGPLGSKLLRIGIVVGPKVVEGWLN